MTDAFWDLIAAGRGDADRLADLLAARPVDEITAFEDRMAEALHALDTPEHFEHAATCSGDGFLYLRCAVVGAGRLAFDQVLRRPAAIARFADDDFEPLLTVALEAYERSTGMLWEYEAPVSYETGSGTDEPGPSSTPWLALIPTWNLRSGRPYRYLPVLHAVVDAIRADPAWAAWWSASGLLELELDLTFETEAADPTLKKGRVRAAAGFTRVPPPPEPDDPVALLPYATDEVATALAAVGERLGLPPVPPMPQVSSGRPGSGR